MMNVFNASNPPRRFQLRDVDNRTMDILPGRFYDIPDSYAGDITLKTALDCGDLKRFESKTEGDALEKEAAEGDALEKESAEGEKGKARRSRGASLLSEEG